MFTTADSGLTVDQLDHHGKTLARDDVDADRLCLYGVSQAGYWVPRALARTARRRSSTRRWRSP